MRPGGRRSATRPPAATLALLLLSCASGAPTLDWCPDLPEVAPLPDAACLAEPAVEAIRESLASAFEFPASKLLVRVEFDGAGRMRKACVKPGDGRRYRPRKLAAARLAELAPLPPAPACLAGHRLDFNRARAKRAEMRRAEEFCAQRTHFARRGPRDFQECVAYEATWLLIERWGGEELLFAVPEVVDPPTKRPWQTVSNCAGISDIEKQVECVEADGWERLE